NQKISGGFERQEPVVLDLENKVAAAYIFKWDSFEDARLLAELIKQNVKTRTVNRELKINGKVFTPGSIVILKSDNEADFVQKINKASHTFGIELTAIQSGFIPQGVDLGSSDIQYLKAPKVAVLANEPTSA